MGISQQEITTAQQLRDRYAQGDREFTGAKLSEADLHNVILHGANLSEAILNRAILTRTDLRGADLSWADLSGAVLTGADLRGAILTRADLSGADLRQANLLRADLSLATLEGVQWTGAIAVDGSVQPAIEATTDGAALGAAGSDREPAIKQLRQELREARSRVAWLEAQLNAMESDSEM